MSGTTVIGIGIIYLMCLLIYFFLKSIELIIRAINLFEKVIKRQEVMIKLLREIRDSGGTEKSMDVEYIDAEYSVDGVKKNKKSMQNNWSDDY